MKHDTVFLVKKILIIVVVLFFISGCSSNQMDANPGLDESTNDWEALISEADKNVLDVDEDALLIQVLVYQRDIANNNSRDYTFVYATSPEKFIKAAKILNNPFYTSEGSLSIPIENFSDVATYRKWDNAIRASAISPDDIVYLLQDRLQRRGEKIANLVTMALYRDDSLVNRSNPSLVWKVLYETGSESDLKSHTLTLDPLTGSILRESP